MRKTYEGRIIMITYIVQPGDTLALIAQRFGSTVQSIVSTNNISDPNLIFVGQVLQIPVAGAPPTATPPTTPAPPTPAPTPPSITVPDGFRLYIVQPADTLAELARRFGTTVQVLVSVNRIPDINLITVGQVLFVPIRPITVVPVPPPSPPTPPAPPTPPTPPGPPVTGVNQVSLVQGGLRHTFMVSRTTFSRGEPVRLSLSKTNVTGSPVSITYRGSQRYDFIVTRAGREIWRWSEGRFFTFAIETISVAPGERLLHIQIWNQTTNRGVPVSPGVYTVTAVNTGTGVRLSIQIEIR
ncbi:MAG: LysM peptidoglycan-binding domain-containing protein [Bacillota bacterium]|nr:LysM peptidoglycan-binding domain-containing protein [Bacillota bacterium]MDI9414842.1 LysM peptidoglycan-binding domain-containing protein [Bacillota bacterium]NLD12444.1 LysM peptidoglycan-binding domain-containing protein [Bacillota bacterium]HOB89227.1 LysM peptidoglycan-binding domain-containing protein [Bacillota bacterium]HOJ58256.1 LysM peptidoglycan-binding domain-containing protein [Bacillota bacterium]